MADVGVAFTLGFLGSVHCVGMCGGFALLAGVGGASAGRRAANVAAWLGGKTLTYAAVGAVLATVVSTTAPAALPVQRVLAVLTGVFLILAGLHMAGLGPAWLLSPPPAASALVSRMSRAVRRSSVGGRFVLGLLNGLLPCGLLYAALALSATMPSPVKGGLFMVAFGLGTAPALAIVAAGATVLSAKRSTVVLRLLGGVVVVMGLLTIFRGAGLMRMLMGGM